MVLGIEGKDAGCDTSRGFKQSRTTIGLKRTTKDKLDHNRAPGQCYDGFIYQLVDLWERTKKRKT